MNRKKLTTAFALLSALLLASCGETTYVFDDVDVGDDQAGRTPQARSDAQFVRAVFADLIGRSTTTTEITIRIGENSQIIAIDEQDTLENTLAGLGDSRALRAILLTGLVDHADANIPNKSDVDDEREFIADQFRRFLGRQPSIYELETFVREWSEDDAVTPKTIIRALLGSREYQSL